ncbi:hypothetical protein CBR_g40671 [Chara braunii]|uniref:malate dehydrogenase n=1 Tax=Chara braunii TaxID=69332 RepID=A0A388LU69_CHABU|nr:hypothetical protein CBR_g40671 [Chara braunii]|eukprot:GBG85860.1 hypothetical protein CBR_g40671 [Chara braunii]
MEMNEVLRRQSSGKRGSESMAARKMSRILFRSPGCGLQSACSDRDSEQCYRVCTVWRGTPLPLVLSSSVTPMTGDNPPPRIAIDLGTSSCAVAVCRNGRVEVIPDVYGKLAAPSAVAFTDTKRLVGEQAQKQLLRRSENLLYEVKRLIGRDFNSIREKERRWWSFSVVRGGSGEPGEAMQAMLEVRSEHLSSLMSNRGRQTTVGYGERKVCGMESEGGGWAFGAEQQISSSVGSSARHQITSSMGSTAESLMSNHGGQTTERKVCGMESEGGGWPFWPGQQITSSIGSSARHQLNSSMGSAVELWPGGDISGRESELAGSSTTEDASTKTLLAPEQVLAMLLAKLKGDAERFLKCGNLPAAVITVPALYCDKQRSATKLAAEIAGFTDVKLVSESTAAALSYAHHTGLISLGSCPGVSPPEETRRRTRMLVFSVGGGSFEVALVTIAGGVLSVNSACGNPSLGGMDFDHKMMEEILAGVKEQFDQTPALNATNLRELKAASEKAKKDLTLLDDAQVDLEFLCGDGDAKLVIRREKFEKNSKCLVEKCMDCVKEVLRVGQTNPSDLNEVVLVGGSTRIPKVVDMLRKTLNFSLGPKSHPFQDEAVVRGAALFAAGFSDKIADIHPVLIGYFDHRLGEYVSSRPSRRPIRYDLPAVINAWSHDVRDRQMKLEIYENTVGGKGCIRTGTIAMAAVGPGDVNRCVLPGITIDGCGILGLDAGGPPGSVSAARLYKDGRRSTDEIHRWKQLAEKLTLCERRIAEMSSAKNRCRKYIAEVEKRKSSCPSWLWSTLSEWKCDIERWLGKEEGQDDEGGIEQFTVIFGDFRRGCRWALGDLWARSISGRRFLVVDSWDTSDVDQSVQNLMTYGGRRELCDVVVSMPFKELRKMKERIEGIEGVEVATHCFSFDANPIAVKESGIPYAVVSAGPVSPSGDGALLCHARNKIVGQQVALAVQAGLRVVLCLGRYDCRGDQASDRSFERKEEQRLCEGQLRDIVPPIGRDWRNIEIAYMPPHHHLSSSSLPLPREEEAYSAPRSGGALLDVVEVLQTIRHIRGVIRGLVNEEAADTTRVLVGGCCSTVGMWDDLIKHDEIQGLVFEGGFRDPLLVDKLRVPSRERRGKVLLCRGENGHASLDKRNIERLQRVSEEVMGGEEVLWITVRNAMSERLGYLRERQTGSIDFVWKGGALVEDDCQQAINPPRREVTIVPLCGGWHEEELAQIIENQLSSWSDYLKRADFANGEEVVVEYRAAPGVVDVEVPRQNLPLAIETAHARIRRWILTKISPYVAQAVRIVCSLDDLTQQTETHREIAKQPNVDGLSLHVEHPGNAPTLGGKATENGPLTQDPFMKPTLVLLTGAASTVGRALVPLIAMGRLLGPHQPVILHMLDAESNMDRLKTMQEEVLRAAHPLLRSIKVTSDVNEAARGVSLACVLGGDRGGCDPDPGTPVETLISDNVPLFQGLAQSLQRRADRDVKVVVAADPANTNAFIMQASAPQINPQNITCLSRVYHNRAVSLIAQRVGVPVVDVKNVTVWGGQSVRGCLDVSHVVVMTGKGVYKRITDVVDDNNWLEEEFIHSFWRQEGQIDVAMSVARAVCDHVSDWLMGTPEDSWVSMGVPSDGSYGVPRGLIYSFPVWIANGRWEILHGLPIDKHLREKMNDAVRQLAHHRSLAQAAIERSNRNDEGRDCLGTPGYLGMYSQTRSAEVSGVGQYRIG